MSDSDSDDQEDIEYYRKIDFVANAQNGIPKLCPCGSITKEIVDANDTYDYLPGKRYFICKDFENDGLHFRQPWVTGVYEEVERLKLRVHEHEQLLKEWHWLKEEVGILTRRVAQLERVPVRGADKGTERAVKTSCEEGRAYIERNREEGHERLWNDYFSDNAVFPPNLFRRRFRMNKDVFLRIVNRLEENITFFQQRPDAVGRLGLSAITKCTAAIRLLAYGCAADAVDEYLRLGESTTLSCLSHFTQGVIQLFGEEYLRRPTADDLRRLLDIGEIRGFPGMIGSIDCMHWEWKNCPTAWKGQYTRGSGKPTIVLEAVASQDLWIWHSFFGAPGTLNDMNVLDRSPVFDDIIQGRAPPVHFVVNGNQYDLPYYLTDGIYPKWPTFIQSISLPQGPKAELFATVQESTRKDVKRAFGVLQARFAIVKNPAKLWSKRKIGMVMRTCIILHNMIVENERDGYTQYDTSEFEEGESSRSSQVDTSYTTNNASHFGNMLGLRSHIRDRRIHEQLKNDLVENVWNKFGNNGNNQDV